jgi:ionotropic glutamate receptor
MKESGTLMQLQNKWWVDRSECPQEEKATAEADDELSLQSLAGIFYILIAGLALAALVALVEFCWQQRKDRRKRARAAAAVTATSSVASTAASGRSQQQPQPQRRLIVRESVPSL